MTEMPDVLSDRQRLRRLMRAFLLRAVVTLIVCAVLHLLGFRKYTCVLSGTSPFGTIRSLCGIVYIMFYGLAIVCVPVFLLAAVLARAAELVVSIGASHRDAASQMQTE